VEAALHEGEAAGERAVGRMRSDGFDATWTGTVPVGPGYWYSALTPPRPPLLPLLGKARTFYMTSGDQFRPAPPPAFGSAEFKTALAEVRRFSDTRTAEQQKIAEKWAMATGSLVAGYWNEVTAGLVKGAELNEREAAHAFALATTAAWDANVACHDAKYTYWMIRPSEADAGIKTAIGLPNHPSYPSNHSCLSGAVAIVLGELFPAQREPLWASAIEASESRVYAGLHYRFDLEAGLGIAKSVAGLAIAKDRAAGGRF
jgi:membrane-associated phospholipid phosphatase